MTAALERDSSDRHPRTVPSGLPLARDARRIIRVGRKEELNMSNLVHFRNGRSHQMPSLLSWDPLRIFDELMRWEPHGSQTLWSAMQSPLRVHDEEDSATITVDMPGVDAEDVDLTLHAGTLTITGKRGEHTYRYAVTLSDAIDPNSLDADLAKGVLTIKAHKRPEAKPRKIALKGGETRRLGKGE
jgi:HSP20 family molecular chaperone IbpA